MILYYKVECELAVTVKDNPDLYAADAEGKQIVDNTVALMNTDNTAQSAVKRHMIWVNDRSKYKHAKTITGRRWT